MIKRNLYFLYEVSDTTLVYNDEKTEASVGNGDRIEFFIEQGSGDEDVLLCGDRSEGESDGL